jgi:phosphatidylserine decarboxylase
MVGQAPPYESFYMTIPLTKYGWPQVVAFPAGILALMVCLLVVGVAFLPAWAVILAEAGLAVFLIAVLAFFRDPQRSVPDDKDILLAPADGRITDIETIEEPAFIGGKTLRIGIFMSIFNAHVNRAPCRVKVQKTSHRPGKYKNAMNPQSGVVNESNALYLVRTDNPADKLIVRQISGAVARRIVCRVRPGQQLAAGERFGMIKFGSRAELYVPLQRGDDNAWRPKRLVQIDDKVKAGLTPLVKYEMEPRPTGKQQSSESASLIAGPLSPDG